MPIKHSETSTATMAKIVLAWFLAFILNISAILMVSLYLMQISNMLNRFKSLQKIVDRFSILGKFQLLPNKNAQIALSLLVGFGLLTLTPLVMVLCINKAEVTLDLETQENFHVNASLISLLILSVGLSYPLLVLCLAIGCAASAYTLENSNIFTGNVCLIFSLLLEIGINRNFEYLQAQEYKSQERENPLYEYRTSPSCQFDQPTVNYNDNNPIMASA